MKPAHFLLISAPIIIGGIVLLYPSTNTQPANSISSPLTPTVVALAPIDPTPAVYIFSAEATDSATTTLTPTPTQASSNENTAIQIIKATYGSPFGFNPTELTVKVGLPVRLEVYAAENGRGCMGSITIPAFTSEIQGFTKGQTDVFEFTPQTPGTYPITCAMGIPHGNIIVK